MRYYGVHLGHDAAITIIDEDGSAHFYLAERYKPRHKHILGDLTPIFREFPKFPKPSKEDILTLVYTSNPWQLDLDTNTPYPHLAQEFTQSEPHIKQQLGKEPDWVITHHIGHALAAWCYRTSDEEKTFITYDGAGCDLTNSIISSAIGWISPDGFGLYENAPRIPSTCAISKLINNQDFTAGKSMGLAGYLPDAKWKDEMVLRLTDPNLLGFNGGLPYPYVTDFSQESMEFVAAFYRLQMGFVWDAVETAIEMFPLNGVVIGGGATLALEVNTKIFNKTGNVDFAPCTDDSGLTLGAAAFGYFHDTGKWPKLNTASLNEMRNPLPAVGPQDPQSIAKRIADGRVVGLLRGRAEVGPRALGFRSIFAEASEEMLVKVSQGIKGREWFRPLAPIVTEEQFPDLFDGPQGKYMQYKVECTEECRKHLPAVVHKDNSSRPQVVSKEDDPWLHELLKEYGKITGHECFINTSLNVAGTPICNSHGDAMKDMKGKDVQIISIGGS